MRKKENRFPIGTLRQFREDVKSTETSQLKKMKSFYDKFSPESTKGKQNLKAIEKELRKRRFKK